MHGQFLARLCALAVGALAPAPLPIRQAVSAVAANEDGAIAATPDEVRIMDGGGFPVVRFSRAGAPLAAPPRRRARPWGTFAAAAGVLADGDFNDPHDPDSEVEDPENILVEDDAPARHHVRSIAGQAGVAVAVGGACAWLGRDDGLWRIPFRGVAEKATLPGGGPLRAVATGQDGRLVVAALDSGLVRSSDGGERFERIADAPAGVTRLAVTGGGRVYAVTPQGLHQVEGAEGRAPLVTDADDVVPCGSGALALAHHRIIQLPEAGSVTAAVARATEAAPVLPLGAERLACAPDGTVWIAYGAALWMSEDRGQSWTPRDDLPVTSALDAVAVTRWSLWVASGAGLAVLPLRTVGPTLGGAPSSSSPPGPGAGVDSRPRWRWWLAALPSVELGVATARSNARREVRAFLLLSFTFDPRRAPRAERQLDAEGRTAQTRDQTQRWLTRDSQVDRRLDPVAAEERDATLRLLDD